MNDQYEDVPAGRIDWKMEAERANRIGASLAKQLQASMERNAALVEAAMNLTEEIMTNDTHESWKKLYNLVHNKV